MSPIKGLHFVIAAAVLQLQAGNTAVIRNTETTTLLAEPDWQTPTQVSSLSDSTIPQDLLGQTTLPPIPLRSSTDTDTIDGTDTNTEIPAQYQTVPNVQPQPPSIILPRAELQLGGQSTLANTTEMGSNPTLVPTTELAYISSRVPDVEQPTVGTLVTTVTEIEPALSSEIPSKVQSEENESVSTRPEVQKDDTLSIPKFMPRNSQGSPDNVVERPQMNADSFVSTTVQILAYAVDTLWENEMKNRADNDSYNVAENASDTSSKEWDEDDSSKPVFQFNVPIVNEESVPMRVHMDIVPQGFPEDLEDQTFYPDYFEDKSEYLYDSDALNSVGRNNPDNSSKKDADSAGSDEDRFLKIRQQMRRDHNSDTFEKLVDIHKNLAAYVENHDTKTFKKIPDRETDVLLRNTHNVAEQLKNVIPIIFEEIDDKQLKDNLKTFLNCISERNSESFIVLSTIAPLRYS